MSFGQAYTLNGNQLVEYNQTSFGSYVDVTHNREKILTSGNVGSLGYTHVTTYFDYSAKKAYKQIPKIGQCTVYDLPADFNLPQYFADIKNCDSGATTYKGEVTLPWVAGQTYYQFDIKTKYITETRYFESDDLDLHWIKKDGLIYSIPAGPLFRVFTDDEFSYLTCSASAISAGEYPISLI